MLAQAATEIAWYLRVLENGAAVAIGAVVGGFITIAGIYVNNRMQQKNRSAEKVADAYGEYVSATEQMLRTAQRVSQMQETCESAPGARISNTLRDGLLESAAQAERERARQHAAYIVVLFCEPKPNRRSKTSEFQRRILPLFNKINEQWTSTIVREAYKALEDFMLYLEGQLSK